MPFSVARSTRTSAKRYVLFNLVEDWRPILRKASADGLGHLMEPYADADAPSEVPAPSVALEAIGVKRWQYDLWFKIIEAALRSDPDRVSLNYHPALQSAAPIRYTGSSP
jgi:hypothetical protein